MTPAGVDEWMEAELRLAERRDLLKGRHLSPVQVRAVEILNFLDKIEQMKRQYDLFRAALVATGSYKPQAIWPEYQKLFGSNESKEEAKTDPLDSSNPDFDYSEVEWKSPTENPQEFEDLMAKVAVLSKGSFNGDRIPLPTRFPGQGEWR